VFGALGCGSGENLVAFSGEVQCLERMECVSTTGGFRWPDALGLPLSGRASDCARRISAGSLWLGLATICARLELSVGDRGGRCLMTALDRSSALFSTRSRPIRARCLDRLFARAAQGRGHETGQVACLVVGCSVCCLLVLRLVVAR